MKTWRPTAAGILSITGGAINFILGVSHIVVGLGFVTATTHKGELLQGILSLLLAVIAIAGGISAIKRRVWGFALAGAICAIYSPHLYGRFIWTPILGIMAVVLLLISKTEFSGTISGS